MTEYVKKSDVLELLSLPKDLIAEYVCDLKGLWIDDDEAEQTEPQTETSTNSEKVQLTDEPQTCETCKWHIKWYPCKPFIEYCECQYTPKDKPQTEIKRGCTHCKDKADCPDAFTEVSQYCGAYEQTDCPWR